MYSTAARNAMHDQNKLGLGRMQVRRLAEVARSAFDGSQTKGSAYRDIAAATMA